MPKVDLELETIFLFPGEDCGRDSLMLKSRFGIGMSLLLEPKLGPEVLLLK